MRVGAIAVFLFTLISQGVFAQQEDVLRIGLFGGRGLTKAHLQALAASTLRVENNRIITTLNANDKCTLSATGNRVVVQYKGSTLGSFERVVLQGHTPDAGFRLKALSGNAEVLHTVYPGNLIARAKEGKLLLVNEVLLDEYTGGVTEAESGKGQTLEYYKVQAMIARTYALSNQQKHAPSGFNLCDEVHCQAYKGRSRFEPLIPEAVDATRDQVLVDADIELITAAFHSNCGGHTLNSEHVWSKPLGYLVGRPDTFCLVMPHSHWEKSIDRTQWVTYLQKNGVKSSPSQSDTALNLSYYPSERHRFFADSLTRIRMTEIRRAFGLKSAFFVIDDDGDQLQLTGRGFGHGVGLCQEGAMRMAQLGYDCRSIIHFYYRDVHIIDRRQIRFFAE